MAAPFYQTEQHLDRIALELPDGVTIRYQDLARLADHFAQHFVRNDIWPEQLCALQCRNNLMTIVAFLSCLRHRRPVVLLPANMELSTIQSLSRQFEISALISPYGEVERLSSTSFHAHPELMLLRADSAIVPDALLAFNRSQVLDAAMQNADLFALRATDQLLLTQSLDHPLALMQCMAAFSVGASLKVSQHPSNSRAFWQTVLATPDAQLWLSASILQHWLALPVQVQQRLQNPLRCVLPLAPTESLPRLGQWLVYYQDESLTPLSINPDAWHLAIEREQLIGEMLFEAYAGTPELGRMQFSQLHACQQPATQASQLRQSLPSQIFDSVTALRIQTDQSLLPHDDFQGHSYWHDLRINLRALEQTFVRHKLKAVFCCKNQRLVIALIQDSPDKSQLERATILLDSLLRPQKIVYSVVILRDIPYLPGFKVNVDAIMAMAKHTDAIPSTQAQ